MWTFTVEIWTVSIWGSHYTGKLCHRGKCHSGNCHSGERWMSRPFVHSGNLNFKHTLSNDLVFHNAWKRIICHFYNIKKDMLLTGPFAMLSMPSSDFHLPPCTEGFLIHLSPLWQLPLRWLPLFPSVAQFPCVPCTVTNYRYSHCYLIPDAVTSIHCTHTHTPTCPGIQSEDTIYTRVYSVFVQAFKARTKRVRTVHIVTKRGLKFWPRLSKCPHFECKKLILVLALNAGPNTHPYVDTHSKRGIVCECV